MKPKDVNDVFAPNFQALSLFRICFAVYLLAHFFVTTHFFYGDFYSDAGVLPISALEAEIDRPGLIRILPLLRIIEPFQSSWIFTTVYSISLLSLALGYRTRAANGLVFALTAFLYWRNPYLNSGAETLSCLLLLWSLFLPMNRYWSVDSALDPRDRRRKYPMLPFWALRIQISSLYVFGALFKVAGAPWQEGVAVTWALSDTVFGGSSLGLAIINRAPSVVGFVNYILVVFQIAFPFLVYFPWRNSLVRLLALLASAAMHLSFIVFLNVGGFPFVCLTMLLLLIPDAWIDRLLSKRREALGKITIFYDSECSFCKKISFIFREMFLGPVGKVRPGSANPVVNELIITNRSWVVRGSLGDYYLKWHAVAFLLSQNPLSFPLAWISERSFMRGPANYAYDLIGKNRMLLSTLTKRLLPLNTEPSPGRFSLSLCGFLTLMALGCNILSIVNLIYPTPYFVEDIFAILQVKQKWEMFAPVPSHFKWNYRMTAILQDGSVHDSTKLLSKPIIELDGISKVSFTSTRWMKYFTRFYDLNEKAWVSFGRYLCRENQAALPIGQTVRSVEVFLNAEAIAGAPANTDPIVMRSFDCTNRIL